MISLSNSPIPSPSLLENQGSTKFSGNRSRVQKRRIISLILLTIVFFSCYQLEQVIINRFTGRMGRKTQKRNYDWQLRMSGGVKALGLNSPASDMPASRVIVEEEVKSGGRKLDLEWLELDSLVSMKGTAVPHAPTSSDEQSVIDAIEDSIFM